MRAIKSQTSTCQANDQPHCQLDNRSRLLPQPGRSRITLECLSQTVSEALTMALDLLDEEDVYLQALAKAPAQGLPASQFEEQHTNRATSAVTAKRKR
jgi:hypothetical protein